MLSKYKLNQLYFKDTQFANLMTRRIFNVLLIANPYDAFMLEDDGRIDEKIFNEYTSLSLRYPPRFSQVSTEEEALSQLENMSFDLVICMPSTGDNDSFDIGRHIKEKYEHIPIVILTPFSHGITKRIINEDLSAFEYVFCWLGNTDLLVSIIKLIEDKMNLEHDVFIEQKEVGAGRAVIAGHVELDADKDMDGVLVTITDEATGRVLGEWQADLKRGTNRVTVDFVLHKPKLWWSNGLGEPFLYRFRTDIIAGGELLDSKTERVGIRSLKVVHQPDKDGHTFYIELNGRPVFAKGANYIPSDNFLPRVTPENYKRTILDAAGVNMNMLRVWGGGIYENDVFYDLCDEHGIMIWQDFMFACSMYPAEGALLDNIHQEAVDNVKRLRNHACIALWCGNNECQDAWLGWGWKCEIERQNKEYADKIWAQYRQQYHVTLPGVVREYAPGTFYWPSSPFAFEGEMSGTTDGDRHYWSVWHGKAPISDYDSEKSRFFSEYGFQSFPEFDSVKRYAPYPEDWDIRSEVMMSHQRGGDHANGLIETYLLNEYKKPRDFRAFLYMNHVLQGDAIKTAIESHRRQMPYNMGTLFWQHNDCWPVASWASRDYYGRWKAQHYYTRKVYDDILISPVVEGDDLKVYAVSDRLENTSGRLQLQVCRFDGTVVYHWDKSVGISGNDSRVCFSAPLAKLLEGADRGTVYVRVDYTDKSGRVYHNNYCLDKQKNMNYPKVDLQTEVRSIEGGYEVTVSTDKFARAVCLSVADNESVYSDNYFDVQPKSSVQVQVRTRLSAEAFNASLRLTCLNNEF